MNNTLHTPGHWKKEGATILQDITNQEVCKMLGKNEEIQNANARLIASAPDLLSALEFLLADYIAINGENLTGSSVPADKAREALRKAKGEA